tara:strand:+ start:165 stop:473 length:309 start_codon:yes stop_codon:yes gene_type:complete
MDIDSMEMDIIEEGIATKEEAFWRERYYFENNECINANRPILSQEERKHKRDKWNDDNKEYIYKKQRDYRENNREEVNRKHREYMKRKKERNLMSLEDKIEV